MLLIVAGKAGDAIYSLSVAKRFADLRNERVDVLLDAFHFCDEKNEIQDKQFVTGLFALIRSQPYIASCDVLGKTTMATFNGVDRCDLREWFRDYDHRNNVLRDLLESVEYEHEGFSSADPAAPWLLCECVSTESTVVNWTGRYVTQCEQQDEWNANLAILREKVSQNPNPTFLGLESEHAAFSDLVSSLPYQHTPTLLDAMQLISSASLFIGNPSSCLAIAHGLGKRVIVHASDEYPNTIITGRGSEYFGVSSEAIGQYGIEATASIESEEQQ